MIKIFPWNGFQIICQGQRTFTPTSLHFHGKGIEEQEIGGTDGKLPVAEWQVGLKNCSNKLLPISIASSPSKNSLKPNSTNPRCKKAFGCTIWDHFGVFNFTNPITVFPSLSSLTALELWIWKFWEGFSVALEDLTGLCWWVCGVPVIADPLEQLLIFPCTLMWAGLHRSPTKLFSAFHSFSLKV